MGDRIKKSNHVRKADIAYKIVSVRDDIHMYILCAICRLTVWKEWNGIGNGGLVTKRLSETQAACLGSGFSWQSNMATEEPATYPLSFKDKLNRKDTVWPGGGQRPYEA
jgi:hypothetical protein